MAAIGNTGDSARCALQRGAIKIGQATTESGLYMCAEIVSQVGTCQIQNTWGHAHQQPRMDSAPE